MQVDKWTDKELERLEARIKKEYKKAGDDLAEYYDHYINGYDEVKGGDTIHHAGLYERRAKEYEAYKSGAYKDPTGKYTDEEMFNRWLASQEGRGQHIELMMKQMDDRLQDAGKIARDYTNGVLPSVWINNNNAVADLAQASAMEQGVTGVRFDLVDEYTVKRLMEGSREVRPYKPIALDLPKMSKYNRTKLQNAVLEGILAGDSIDKMAKRFEKVVGMNRSNAIRNARTAVTGAQSAGKQARYEDLADKGCTATKIWVATEDDRTREEHAEADGQEVDYNEPFEVGGEELMYPADPSGSDWNIYNCRCTTRAGKFIFHSILSDRARELDTIEVSDSMSMNYNDMLSQRDEIKGRLEQAREEQKQTELEALTTMDAVAWEKAGKLSEEVKEIEKELDVITGNIKKAQGERADELMKSLVDKGYCEKAFIPNVMSIDAMDAIEKSLDSLIGGQGLPPVKSVVYDSKNCALRGCVAYYDPYSDSIRLSSKFKMSNEEYAEYHAGNVKKYADYRAKHDIVGLSEKFMAEAQQRYDEATDKAHKHFALQDYQNALINKNIERKSIPESLADIITHEYGHAIQIKATDNIYSNNAKIFGHDILKAKDASWNPNDLAGKVLASELGAYAIESPLECFAEAFTAYQKGIPMSKELTELVESAIEKVGVSK